MRSRVIRNVTTAWRVTAASTAMAAVLACGPERASKNDSVATIARDTVIIDATAPSCATCRLDVMPPIQLGTPDDRDIPQRVPDIVRDGRGTHYLVFNGWSDKPVLRYDSTGRYIGRLGSLGQGPGEYSMTFDAIVGPGDSLLLLDWGSRGQVFAPDGSFARLARTSAGHHIWAMAPDGTGAMYARGATRMESMGGHPHVVRIGPGGLPVDSFPVFSAVLDSSTVTSGSRQRRVAVRLSGSPTMAPDGSIWTSVDGVRLEHHAPDGRTEQLIGLRLPDLPPPIMTAPPAESIAAARERNPAHLQPVAFRHPGSGKTLRRKTTMRVDTAGLLWIVRTQPAPRFDTIAVNLQYLAPDEAPGESTIPREVEDRLYHTIVEVIDPRGPALLARATLPFQGHVAAPGYIGRVTQDDSGHYISSIDRLVLRRTP